MAAFAEQKVTELDEKFLTCEICADLYKRPRILLCHHTFCQECLEKWAEANKDQELTCPNCRQPWQVPVGGVEKLSANYYVNSLIDFVVDNRKAGAASENVTVSEKCEFCESQEATLACLECAHAACDNCAKGHKRIRATAGHQIVSLEDYRANRDSQPAKLKPSECDRHPGIQLKYFCQTCSVPTCLECTIIEHPVPEHKHIYLNEAAREGRVSINTTLKEVQSKLEYYDANEVNLREVKKDLVTFRENLASDVETHTEELVGKIRENGKEIIEKADKIFEAKVKILDSQIERIELAKGQVKSSIGYSQSLVELGTDAGLMSVHKQTQEMLGSLLREEIQVEPQVNHHLQYLANPAFANGLQGSVVDSKAVACRSVVEGLRPDVPFRHKAVFQLVTHDLHGNEVRQGGAEVTAEVTTAQGSRVDCGITDNNNGTYDITFTPTQTRAHWIRVFLFGQLVKENVVQISAPPLPPLPWKTIKVVANKAGGGGPVQFRQPWGIAVSKVNGDIFVANHANYLIQVFKVNGEYQRHFTLVCGGQRVKPRSMAFTREDHLVVTDEEGKQVCVCDTDGKLLRCFGGGELERPAGVAVGSDGRIHVADWDGECVKTFTPEGALVGTIGSEGDQPGQFVCPHSVAVNSMDQILVSDSGNDRVQVFDSSGAFLFACGKKGEGEGELKSPTGVTVDVYDNIMVCDSDNNRIVMFSPEGDFRGRVDNPYDVVKSPMAITTGPGQPFTLILTEWDNNLIRIL